MTSVSPAVALPASDSSASWASTAPDRSITTSPSAVTRGTPGRNADSGTDWMDAAVSAGSEPAWTVSRAAPDSTVTASLAPPTEPEAPARPVQNSIRIRPVTGSAGPNVWTAVSGRVAFNV